MNGYWTHKDDEKRIEQQRWEKEITDHIGFRRHKNTTDIYNSYIRMLEQYFSLRQHLTMPEKNRGITFDSDRIGNLQTAVDEKILVATSSMTSFLDTVDNAKAWENTDYFCEIKEKNNQIIKKENNSFLKKLRQYLNHYGLIPWILIGADPSKAFTFCINAETMLKFDGWNKSDKKIIKSLSLREVSLTSIIYSYLEEMGELWDPAIKALGSMNNKDLEENNAMKKQVISLLTNKNFAGRV